jgi:dTDP-4-amino-4,6-dideoxygalactose transaminase
MLVTKTAVLPETQYQPSFFYGSAREGMLDFLTHALDVPNDGVLLPAFIGWSPKEGSGVFDPVLALGARAGFYGIQADLSVDLCDLESRLRNDAFRVLVVIHYFGRTDPAISEIKDMADKYNVLVVEDLAHGFFSAISDGEAGKHCHVKLFSLHKMFPMEAGGLVTYADSSLVDGQKSTRPQLAVDVMSYNWDGIGLLRRRNFQLLAELLAGLPECGEDFVLIWPQLDAHDVPQTLPVRITGNNRDEVYVGMNADGFGMVSLYHTLIDAVQAGFEDAVDLSEHIINFPVHQDIETGAFTLMVESFRRNLRVSRA